MFKGIQLILALSMLASFNAFAESKVVSDTLIGKVFAVCRGYGVGVKTQSKYEEDGKVCIRFECEVTTDDPDGVAGAEARAHQPVCVSKAEYDAKEEEAVKRAKDKVEDDYFGELEREAENRNSADYEGEYELRFDGEIFKCFAGEKRKSCLERHGFDVSLDWGVTRDGKVIIDADGSLGGSADGSGSGNISVNGRCVEVKEERFLGFLWKTGDLEVDIDKDCLEGGVSADGSFDLEGELDVYGEIDKNCKKRVKRANGKGYRTVTKKNCRGSGSGTAAGYEVIVDADIDGRIGGSSRRGSSRSRSGYKLRIDGKLFSCAYDEDEDDCIDRLYASGRISGSIDLDNCVHCGSRWRSSRRGADGNSWGAILSGAANLAGAVLPPVMMYKGMKVQANAFLGAEEAKWGAIASGFEQCQIMQTNYVDSTYAHIQANELPDRTITPPECNGYGIGQYAGVHGWRDNGWGGWGNAWGSAGYSPAFLAGIQGPGANYRLGYDVTSGLVNPFSGLNAHANLDLSALLGLSSGRYNTSWNGRYNVPGWGPSGSFSTRFDPRLSGNLTLNGAFDPRWNATSTGLVPWANANGSYWANTGGTGRYTYPHGGNGSVNGGDWWSIQDSYARNRQAASVGSYYQDIALARNVDRAYNNYARGTTGYAPFAPSNASASLGLGWSFNF